MSIIKGHGTEVIPAGQDHEYVGKMFFGGAGHGINQTPSSPPAPVEPSYEQKLWDEVAVQEFVAGDHRLSREDMAREAFCSADAFMAERAKRTVR